MIHFYSVWRGIPKDQLLKTFENDGYKGLPMIAVDIKLMPNEDLIIGKVPTVATKTDLDRGNHGRGNFRQLSPTISKFTRNFIGSGRQRFLCYAQVSYDKQSCH